MKSYCAKSSLLSGVLLAGALLHAAAQEPQPIIVTPSNLMNTVVSPRGIRMLSLDLLNPVTGEVTLAASAWRLGTPTFADKQIVGSGEYNASSVHAADFDGDGDQDAVSATFYGNTVSWWENRGAGLPWVGHRIANGFSGAQSVWAEDFDGDGDADVVGVAYYSNQLWWWENASGDGSSWIPHVVDSYFRLPHEVAAADMDGDGDTDILAAEAGANKVAWFENARGDGSLWIKHIAANMSGVRSVVAADFDSDGDLDVGAVSGSGAVRWEENVDGTGSQWKEHIVDDGALGAYVVTAADFNGDGKPDLIAAVYELNAIVWWENPGGGARWVKHVIDPSSLGARAVCAADLDGDGDMDAVGAAWWSESVVWYENVDGWGEQWAAHVLDSDANGVCWLHAADMNGDGTPDVLGAVALAHEDRLWINDMTPSWLRAEPRLIHVPAGGDAEVEITFDAKDLLEGDHAEGRIRLTYAGSEAVAALVPVSMDVVVDTNAPHTHCDITPAANDWGWHNVDVAVTLASDDEGTGVRDIHYALDGAWMVIPGDACDFAVAGEGIHSLGYFAVDNAGSFEPAHDTEIRLDKTAPDLELRLLRKGTANRKGKRPVELRYAATDDLSGVRDLRAGLVLPNLGGYKYRLWRTPGLLRIAIDQRKRRIEIHAHDPQAVLEQIRAGMLPVDCGQQLDLMLRRQSREWTIQRTGRVLKVMAPSVVFKATASDYADNVAVKELSTQEQVGTLDGKQTR